MRQKFYICSMLELRSYLILRLGPPSVLRGDVSGGDV